MCHQFWEPFWHRSSLIFIFVAKVANHEQHKKINGVSMFLLFRDLTFLIKLRSQIHICFSVLILFSFLFEFYAEKIGFENPFKIQWAPKCVPKSTKWLQKTTIKHPVSICKTYFVPGPISERLLGTISSDVPWILNDF